jgi:hypothetical protein
MKALFEDILFGLMLACIFILIFYLVDLFLYILACRAFAGQPLNVNIILLLYGRKTRSLH